MVSIKNLFIYFVCLAIFYSPFIDNVFPILNTRLLFTLIFLFLLFLFALKEKKIEINLPYHMNKIVVLSLFALFISSTIVWDNFYSINMYIGLFMASVVYLMGKEIFLKFLLFTLVVQVFLQTYEYFSVSYIYEPIISMYGFEQQNTLESMYILRTKGLFEGPLTASSFAIYIAYIFRYNPIIISLAIFSTILANTRTGMITTTAILILYSFFKRGKNSINRATIFAGVVIMILFAYTYILPLILSEMSFDRVQELSNFTSNESNLKRLFFWSYGWDYYRSYDLQNILFGCSQCFANVYDNSAENDWLMLLLELGFIGFLLYAFPIFYIIKNSLSKKKMYLLCLVSLLIVNIFVYRHISGASTVILHWILIFSLIDELNDENEIKVNYNT